jgi:Putative adhesin
MADANDNLNRPWPELPPKSRGPYVRLKEGLAAPRARRSLKAAGLVVLLVAALIGALAVVLFVTRTYSLDTATYPGPVRRLAIDTDTGEVSVVGSDRRDVLVLWQRRYSLIKPRVDRQLRDRALQLRSRCPAASFRCAVVLGSQVPAATATSVRTRSATVDMQDLGGPVEVTTRTGQVTLQQMAGPVQVVTGSGPVSLAGLRGELAVRTASAPIELRDLHGPTDLTSESGSITGNALALPVLRTRTGSGWVTASFDTPPQQVDVRSVSGQVSLQVPAGRYRLELDAPAGQVHLDGVVDDPAAPRTIRISAGGGIALTSR